MKSKNNVTHNKKTTDGMQFSLKQLFMLILLLLSVVLICYTASAAKMPDSQGPINSIIQCEDIDTDGDGPDIAIYVNTSGWWSKGDVLCTSETPIQDAINNSVEGDTIYVYNGNYTGNMDVNKRLTLQGEGADAVNITTADWKDHVFNVSANQVNISGFNVTGVSVVYDYGGICLANGVEYCNISGNNVSNFNYGIKLNSICSNTITNNTVDSNNYGISLSNSSNNTLMGNTVYSNNRFGIHLSSSSRNRLINNNFNMSGLCVENSYENIVENNTVNDKPLVYYEDTSNTIIQDAGQVILINCSNITVKDLNLSNASIGIELWQSNDSRILNNTVSYNHRSIYLSESSNNTIINNTVLNSHFGIFLFSSSNNTIINSTAHSNGYCGICLDESNNNTLINSTASNQYCGICLDKSSYNTITNSTISENYYGIHLNDSGSNTLINNTGDSNYGYGIYLSSSGNNMLTQNTANSNNYYGIYLDGSNSNTLIDNTANLNNLYGIFLSSSENNTLIGNIANSNKCGIFLSSPNNNTLIGNIANSNNEYGIMLDSSNNNMLINNTLNLNNDSGIYLCSSNNNTFTDNTMCSNILNGILIDYGCNNNTIYLNNFINNSYLKSSTSNNFWNSTNPITYTYDSSNFNNYLGNYWSDYKDSYPDADEMDESGIWDTPYCIDSDKDNYPLMNPRENYCLIENNPPDCS